MSDFRSSSDFPSEGEKLRATPEDEYYRERDDRPLPRNTFWRPLAVVLIVVVIILAGIVGFFVGKLQIPIQIQATPATPTVQTTPQIPPTIQPTEVTPITTTLNLKLYCQHCEELNVTAYLKSYAIDPRGSTSITLTFINQTGQGVNMKVDAIKLLDGSSDAAPVFSNDAYVPVANGQTVPTTIIFTLAPQSNTKYTLSIVMEEANHFSNFYESPPFTMS